MINGNFDFEPTHDDLQALAKRFHHTLTSAQLTESERKGLLSEWRETKAKERAQQSPPAAPLATQDQLAALTQQVIKLVELQQLSVKASVRTAIPVFARSMRPILERKREQRAVLQKDVSQIGASGPSNQSARRTC
jgi:hypothetical protein